MSGGQGLLEKVCSLLFPDLGVAWIDYLVEPGATPGITGFELLRERRREGDLRPVVILGFEPFYRLPAKYGRILRDPRRYAIYYQCLPCTREELHAVAVKAFQGPAAQEFPPDPEAVRLSLCTLKHTCDNLRQVWQGSVNRARTATVPAALGETWAARLRELAEEYERVRRNSGGLELPGSKEVPELFGAAVRAAEELRKPGDIIGRASTCVELVRKLSTVLAGIQETVNNG